MVLDLRSGVSFLRSMRVLLVQGGTFVHSVISTRIIAASANATRFDARDGFGRLHIT